MIIKKILSVSPPGKIAKSLNKDVAYVMETLNELQQENIVQLIANIHGNVVAHYILFYNDKNLFICPGCNHDISNTFSFCPNCGKRLQ